MNTKIIKLISNNTELKFKKTTTALDLIQQLDLIKSFLLSDQLVAIPTETVYGLACNAFSPIAVSKIYSVKNRPSDNPLIVHVSDIKMLKSIVKNQLIVSDYQKLIDSFWPGPLTLIFEIDKESDLYKSNCTSKQLTVGIRMPSNKVARMIIEHVGVPLAAPSCNLSGKPSATKAKHCLEDFNSSIGLIVDDDESEIGLESTILNAMFEKPVVLRPGSITINEISKVLGKEVLCYSNNTDIPTQKIETTPGMKYTHYSPTKSKVGLVYCSENKPVGYYMDIIMSQNVIKDHGKICVIDLNTKPNGLFDCLVNKSKNRQSATLLKYSDVDKLSHDLFDLFRHYDNLDYVLILILLNKETAKNNDSYLALLNRTHKASTFIIN